MDQAALTIHFLNIPDIHDTGYESNPEASSISAKQKRRNNERRFKRGNLRAIYGNFSWDTVNQKCTSTSSQK